MSPTTALSRPSNRCSAESGRTRAGGPLDTLLIEGCDPARLLSVPDRGFRTLFHLNFGDKDEDGYVGPFTRPRVGSKPGPVRRK